MMHQNLFPKCVSKHDEKENTFLIFLSFIRDSKFNVRVST